MDRSLIPWPFVVHAIIDARDALSRKEMRVYRALWGRQDPEDAERIVSKGYDVLARETRTTKRNVARIIQRLADKGFLERLAPPVTSGQRLPATYRVIGWAAVREEQKRMGREWIGYMGRGVLYAYRSGEDWFLETNIA